MRAVMIAAIVSSGVAFSARAETATSAAPLALDAGRYAITPAEGGFMRLDKETGAVAFCTAKDGIALCRAGSSETAALDAEIVRLRKENTELKAQLAAPGVAAPRGVPSEQELDRALSFTERFMRRILKIIREDAPGGDKN
jgi:hypothetical protein